MRSLLWGGTQMKFWIKKENDADPDVERKDSYILTLNRDSSSTIYSGLPSIWYHLGCQKMVPIYEDLFVIGLSVFALDKRIARNLFSDSWTRQIEVSIPVLEMDKWNNCEAQWNKILSFLTGDEWKIYFRQATTEHGTHKNRNRKHIDVSGCDCVSLFSGGLDSYCGAVKLLQEGHSPVLVGHNEYPKLRYIQERFCNNFNECYPVQKSLFLGFTAGARAPFRLDGERLRKSENTSRGRSLLFLCAAISIAGIMGEQIPVYIPENGFIGLNVALTNSRKGSCSTRTTHPYFLNSLNKLIASVGIQNRILNFFAFKTKREIVNLVSGTEAFKRGYKDTISCSHPCVSRYNRVGSREYPVNCGFCYPCIIRKGSLQDVELETDDILKASEFLKTQADRDKSADLFAVLSSIHRYKGLSEKDIERLIRCTGKLENDEIQSFKRVYRQGMDDLIEYFSKDSNMEAYM